MEKYTENREIYEALLPESIPVLSHIFNDEYWTRLWIVQEVLLGTRITLVFDRFAFDLDKLIKFNFNSRNAVSLSNKAYFDSEVDNHGHSMGAVNWGRAMRIIQIRQALSEDAANRDRAMIAIELRRAGRGGTATLGRARRFIRALRGWRAGVVNWSQAERILRAQQPLRVQDLQPRVKCLSIFAALDFMTTQECAFVGDKIYGLLGLLDRARTHITPDYEYGPEDIYTQVLPHLLAAIVHDLQLSSKEQVLRIEHECARLSSALGIRDDDEYCFDVTRLMLQMLGIPLISTKWDECPERGRRHESYPACRQARAFWIGLHRGSRPFYRYLYEDNAGVNDFGSPGKGVADILRIQDEKRDKY
jgi:hypothetical protein